MVVVKRVKVARTVVENFILLEFGNSYIICF
jgi:hypothetical protein